MNLNVWFDALGTGVFGRWDTIVRLLVASALGGLIGLEREANGKPAGFRTNLLICLGAALLMELSIGLAFIGSNGTAAPRGDPARIAAQVVSGMGFLGAGTILHFRGSVTGLTTAATLWVVAAIGLAVGAQAYLEAIFATMLVMLALRLLGRMEDQLIPRPPTDRIIDLVLQPDPGAIRRIEQLLVGNGFKVDTLRIEKGADAFRVSFQARGQSKAWERVMRELLTASDVQRVELN